MIDVKFLRENPEIVKENIRKKFQDVKLPLVDEVIEYDEKSRTAQGEADQLRAERKKLSKQIGALMGKAKKDPSKMAEVDAVKAKVNEMAERLEELDAIKKEADEIVLKNMMVIPNIIDPSVPIGPDDTHNVEIQKYGEPVTAQAAYPATASII